MSNKDIGNKPELTEEEFKKRKEELIKQFKEILRSKIEKFNSNFRRIEYRDRNSKITEADFSLNPDIVNRLLVNTVQNFTDVVNNPDTQTIKQVLTGSLDDVNNFINPRVDSPFTNIQSRILLNFVAKYLMALRSDAIPDDSNARTIAHNILSSEIILPSSKNIFFSDVIIETLQTGNMARVCELINEEYQKTQNFKENQEKLVKSLRDEIDKLTTDFNGIMNDDNKGEISHDREFLQKLKEMDMDACNVMISANRIKDFEVKKEIMTQANELRNEIAKYPFFKTVEKESQSKSRYSLLGVLVGVALVVTALTAPITAPFVVATLLVAGIVGGIVAGVAAATYAYHARESSKFDKDLQNSVKEDTGKLQNVSTEETATQDQTIGVEKRPIESRLDRKDEQEKASNPILHQQRTQEAKPKEKEVSPNKPQKKPEL